MRQDDLGCAGELEVVAEARSDREVDFEVFEPVEFVDPDAVARQELVGSLGKRG
jgi:hypothetical protein